MRKNKDILIIIALIVLFFVCIFWIDTHHASAAPAWPIHHHIKKLKSPAKPKAPAIPHGSNATSTPVDALLFAIGKCESGNEQFRPDGSVKINSSGHIGRFQLSAKYHLARAKKMGYDIYTESGNTLYSIWLYHDSGTFSWLASQSCWRKAKS